MKSNLDARPAEQGAAPVLPQNESASLGFIDFATLRPLIPLCDRTLRDKIRKGEIPSVRFHKSRKRLFWWPAVQAALLRQTTAA